VTAATEHKCVIESARALEGEGASVTVLPVRPDGLIELDGWPMRSRSAPRWFSIMAVNNEIGVIQPLAEIAALAHAKGAWFHSDAAQAAGKIPLDVETMGST